MNARDILRQIADLPRRDTGTIRSLRRSISRKLAATDRDAVLTLAFDLISADPNSRWVAYELVQNHAAARDGIRIGEVERLGQGISNWSAVDAFACSISGPAWRQGRISDVRVARWARSKDRWWRRAALVSTVPLNVQAQGGSGDAQRTLSVCELLLHDRDEMVVKALSWALRALAVRDPEAVSRFVQQHESDLHALARREVRNKLSTGLKNPR
jgi:3-methyladenine DNA glycosylase AlkD